MADALLLYANGTLPDIYLAPLKLFGSLVIGDGSQTPHDHDLLVLDAGTLSTRDLSNLAAHAQKMLDNNRPILVLRPTAAHKSQLAKAQIIPHYIQEDSFALFIEPRRSADGKLRIALAEQLYPPQRSQVVRTFANRQPDGSPLPFHTDEIQLETQKPLNLTHLDAFIKHIRHSVHRLSKGQVLTTSGETGPNDPPANIPADLWDKTPISIYWPLVPHGSEYDGWTPPNGNVTMEALATVGVYYDNLNFNTPVQWLLIEHSGHLTAHLVADDDEHIGWSNGYLSVSGDDISSSSMISNQSSPNNVSKQTQYTTSSEFTVGLQAGTEGLSTNTSYSIGSSETCTISDWEVEQRDPNSWMLDQKEPYDGTCKDFPDGCVDGDWEVAELPAISRGALAFNNQTVWIRQPATTNSLSVCYHYDVQCHYTQSDEDDKKAVHWYWHGWTSRTFVIYFNRAYPS